MKAPADSGAVYIAFGEEYARVAAASACSLAAHVEIPIDVLTNCQAEKFRWPERTTFKHFDLPDEENRAVRTSAVEHTPFDKTLLLDADMLIRSYQAAIPLRYLDRWDMCLTAYKVLEDWADSPQWQSIRRGFGIGAGFVYSGGVIYFQKNGRTKAFFEHWQDYWEREGRGRDMPALARALWASRVRFWPLWAAAGWLGREESVFCHRVGQTVEGLPPMSRKLRPKLGGGFEARLCGDRLEADESWLDRSIQVRPSIGHVGRKFAHLGPGRIRGAEIGVYKGDHAQEIADFLKPGKLYLIDLWNCYEVDGFYGGWMLRTRGETLFNRWRERDWDAVFEAVCRRFAGYPNIEIHRTLSRDMLRIVPPRSLHFIYIDGSHEYSQVVEDLALGWTRLFPGGVLAGHDYYPEKQGDVVRAVDDFGAEHGLDVMAEGTDFWFDKPHRGSPQCY